MQVKVVGKYTIKTWSDWGDQVIVQCKPVVPFRDKFTDRYPTFEIPLDYSESQPELDQIFTLVLDADTPVPASTPAGGDEKST